MPGLSTKRSAATKTNRRIPLLRRLLQGSRKADVGSKKTTAGMVSRDDDDEEAAEVAADG
jgi:hypothetical protein